eukprot:Skav207024  [mRNA]  locus=scaffold2740:254122:260549:+ [translate_table: standard]
MPRVSAMMAARWQAHDTLGIETACREQSKRGEKPSVLRFSEAEVETFADDAVHMDCGSNAADPWFDWSQLDKAEAQARSKSVPPRRSSPMSSERRSKGSGCAQSRARRKRRSRRDSGGRAASPPVRAMSPASASEKEGSGQTFRAWLEQKPPMRLSLGDRIAEEHALEAGWSAGRCSARGGAGLAARAPAPAVLGLGQGCNYSALLLHDERGEMQTIASQFFKTWLWHAVGSKSRSWLDPRTQELLEFSCSSHTSMTKVIEVAPFDPRAKGAPAALLDLT